MRILRYTLFLFAIGLISCEQEFDKKEQQSDCCSFQNLPKYPEQVVNINVHNYIPLIPQHYYKIFFLST